MNGEIVKPLEWWMRSYNYYNFSAVKPKITDPCGSNMFAGMS